MYHFVSSISEDTSAIKPKKGNTGLQAPVAKSKSNPKAAKSKKTKNTMKEKKGKKDKSTKNKPDDKKGSTPYGEAKKNFVAKTLQCVWNVLELRVFSFF